MSVSQHFVPKGWTRGCGIQVITHPSPYINDPHVVAIIKPNHTVSVGSDEKLVFTEVEEFRNWSKWWFAGPELTDAERRLDFYWQQKNGFYDGKPHTDAEVAAKAAADAERMKEYPSNWPRDKAERKAAEAAAKKQAVNPFASKPPAVPAPVANPFAAPQNPFAAPKPPLPKNPFS
jgi:hypothetical protein